jgi:Helix-turn-helix domain
VIDRDTQGKTKTGIIQSVSDLVPLARAATEFGVSEVTLYRYLRAGRLRRYRRSMDLKTYVDRDELRKLREARPVDAPKGP